MLYQDFGYDLPYDLVKLHQQQLLREAALEHLAALVRASSPSHWRAFITKLLRQPLERRRTAGLCAKSRPGAR